MSAGFGGYPPARSALTLRIVLASFGLIVLCAALIALLVRSGPLWLVGVVAVLLIVTVADLMIVIRRKAGGEPG